MTVSAEPPDSRDRSLDRPDPDADIVELVKLDKLHDAIRLLMQRHGATVYRYCLQVLRDPTRAEDVHQNTFIDAYFDLPKFTGRSRVKTWLLAIAHNRAMDDIRRRQREDDRIDRDDTTAGEIADPSPSPCERLDDLQLHNAVEECIAELPAESQSPLLLRYQQGLTYQEIAEICQVSAGTLQTRVARALVKLRECIKKRTRGAP